MRAAQPNPYTDNRTETNHSTHLDLPSTPPTRPALRGGPVDARHTGRRDIAERVVAAAAHLVPAERDLLRAVYERGQPVAQLARLANISPPRLRRRVRALTRRVLRPAFSLTIRQQPRWARERRIVAWSVFVDGLSLREATRRTGLSLHAVRRHRAEVLALAAHSRDGPAWARGRGGAA